MDKELFVIAIVQNSIRWLDCITDSMDMSLGVGDGQGNLVCCSPWDLKESDMIEQLNCLISILHLL